MMRPLRLGVFVIFLSSAPALFGDDVIPEPTQRTDAPFRLFRTLNIHTFLRLDTRTGQVWQVQWSAEPDHRFVEPINSKPLAASKAPGRFTLYPSSNIFTFILLDQEDGRQWQIQWALEVEKRLIFPIEPSTELSGK
jgi:hypothetical protein